MNQIATSMRSTLLALLLVVPVAASGDEAVRTTLENLLAEGLWGEITLESGAVRQIRVESLQADTVEVREVIGPLQARPAVYELARIRTARELGRHRIPRSLAPYRPPKSVRKAVAIELLLPGFGFFYAGETRQGYALLGVSGLAGATALATGRDGAAGWIPFVVWTRIASLLHLRDEVRAVNAAHQERARGLEGRPPPRPGTGALPLAALRFPF